MIGNVVVSLLTAFTIIAMMLYEPAIHYYWFRAGFIKVTKGYAPNPVWVLGIYTYFAFFLTWMREIVKDMEDFKGDAEQGCITMPIKWGLKKTVMFTQVLSALVIIPLLFGAVKLFIAGWLLLGIYTIILLVVPIVIWMLYLPQKFTKEHYHKASNGIKLIMVAGVSSLVIYYFQVHA
jgi:4-hydroxybenzoate polyprenyltransferase